MFLRGFRSVSSGYGDVVAAQSPRLVVIAASAGGLSAIFDVLAPLPASFPAAIAIIQHRGGAQPELMIELLASRTRLRVKHAVDGEMIEPGTVYVCPPGVHMTMGHALRLVEGPKIQFVQPNADLMFESASAAYGDRAIGVVLSGSGYDGALGSLAMARAGGKVLAQDASAMFADMPSAAFRVGSAEVMLPPAEIARELMRLVGRDADEEPAAGDAPPRSAAITVVIVDDHRIVLDGLRALLDSEDGVEVVSVHDNSASALEAITATQPDVCVLDIRMPELDGIGLAQRVCVASPRTRIVALSAESTIHIVDGMLRAGASGYVTKQRAFSELVAAVRTVMDDKVYLSDEIARLVARGIVAAPTPPVRRRT